MLKRFIKEYAVNLICVLIGTLILCGIRFGNTLQVIKQNQNNISQQRIMVTFTPNTSRTDSDKIIKNNINNNELSTTEHLKVKVQTNEQIHNFLKDNHIKVNSDNIGTGYIVTNFKSEKDFNNYAKALQSQKGVALVEKTQLDNVNNTKNSNLISLLALIIVLIVLTLSLTYQKNLKSQMITITILNGGNNKDLIFVNTCLLTLFSLLISGLAIIAFSGIVGFILHDFNNPLLLQNNCNLLISGLIMVFYNSLFYFIYYKMIFKKKITW